MKRVRLIYLIVALTTGLFLIRAYADNPSHTKTRNVILVISDGLRWQEVFGGAEEALMNKEHGGVKDDKGLRKKYWRDSQEARREALLPFFWTVIAKHGQIFGNKNKGSVAKVTNGMNFSYPGYSEILTGFPDPRIDSNDKNPNPNVTVFEWLNKIPSFSNRVAAFATWDVFPYIFNRDRSHLVVKAARDLVSGGKPNVRQELLNQLIRETTPISEDVTYDSFMFHAAIEYLKGKKPRVFFIGFGETDEWAHEGRYDYLLYSAHRVDQYMKQLWETLQSMPKYRDKTTLILTVDHGRGSGPLEWKDHGKKVPESENIWIAFLGPDTPPLGERTENVTVTQSQIAATLAALLGEDYHSAVLQSGAPIPDVLGQARK